jgi:hypothetical protein
VRKLISFHVILLGMLSEGELRYIRRVVTLMEMRHVYRNLIGNPQRTVGGL